MIRITHAVYFVLAFFSAKELEPSATLAAPAKLVCLYRMTSRPDSASTVATQELVQLAIADTISEFRSCNRYKVDSLRITYQNAPVNATNAALATSKIRALPKSSFNEIIIKNTRNKKYHYYGVINKILYEYEGGTDMLKWNLHPETRQVNGYNCQKATTQLGGRNYTAWFTREIAVSDGPYKFSGLPGLVISVNDDTNSYSFELIRTYRPSPIYFIRLPKEVLDYNKQVIVTNRSSYYEAYNAAQRNRIDNMTADGSFIFNNEEQVRKSYQEKLKHRNNPLELK